MGGAMALMMEFDSSNNILRLTIEGPLSDKIMVDVFETAARYGRSHPPCRSIADLSKVTVNEVSTDGIRELAKIPVSAGTLMRVVVAPRDHSYALARMFQMFSENTRPNFHVVRTIDEAYRLLAVVLPEFSSVTTD
jgi:hypothetical protein